MGRAVRPRPGWQGLNGARQPEPGASGVRLRVAWPRGPKPTLRCQLGETTGPPTRARRSPKRG